MLVGGTLMTRNVGNGGDKVWKSPPTDLCASARNSDPGDFFACLDVKASIQGFTIPSGDFVPLSHFDYNRESNWSFRRHVAQAVLRQQRTDKAAEHKSFGAATPACYPSRVRRTGTWFDKGHDSVDRRSSFCVPARLIVSRKEH